MSNAIEYMRENDIMFHRHYNQFGEVVLLTRLEDGYYANGEWISDL